MIGVIKVFFAFLVLLCCLWQPSASDARFLAPAISRRDSSRVELSPSNPCGEVTQPLLAVSGRRRQECLRHRHQGKKARAAIGTRGDELAFSRSINAVVEGHEVGEYTRDDKDPKETVSAVDRVVRTFRRCKQP